MFDIFQNENEKPYDEEKYLNVSRTELKSKMDVSRKMFSPTKSDYSEIYVYPAFDAQFSTLCRASYFS